MFGCLRKIGCLALVLVVAAAAYVTRDRWMSLIRRTPPPARTTATGPTWEPVSDAAAARARQAIESLGRRSGPVFVNLGPGDLASYFYIALSQLLPPSADSIEATTIGDRMYVRAVVSLDDFKAADALGPLAGFVSRRERLQLGGTFAVIKPGLAQFLVEDVRIGQLPIPRGGIPKLLRQIRRGSTPPGVADNGLPFVVPTYLGDARVGAGKITLYKTVR